MSIFAECQIPMSRRPRTSVNAPVTSVASLLVALAISSVAGPSAVAAEPNFPISSDQRAIARQVAQAGVPIGELSPTAPDSHVVKPGDTLWGISGMFLQRPWRWPELWGMNIDQVRNPHLIYPGQVLYLEKADGRARMRMGQAVGGDTVKLSPRVRSADMDANGISSIPLHLIQPFLNEAVVFDTNALVSAPRIVAAQEGRVLLSKGDTAYVRGDLSSLRDYRMFREPKPLLDPTTGEILGYEAAFLGTAEYVRAGSTQTDAAGKPEIVPATFLVTSTRNEAGVGDRLAPLGEQEFTNFTPHAPKDPMSGRVISIYGGALNAGQNQIVALNRGKREGMERGHVMALWRNGERIVDKTDPTAPVMKLPDERHGMLFVFRVFERVSYALILSVQEPVKAGDRFTQP
ncbi:LysM peptidoglycan-binding domain-containing protein [soil metagenome]